MKSPLLLASLCALAPAANALTLTLENPIVAATVPATGTASYALRGTLALSPGETFAGGGGASAFDGAGNSVGIRSDGLALSAALANSPSYTGVLAYLDVDSTDPAGRYDVDSSGFSMPSISFFVDTLQGTTVTASATYAVEVAPVPEPASLSVLAVGALALARRRRR